MITGCIKPDQKLAVASHEYKEIIEKTMVSISSFFFAYVSEKFEHQFYCGFFSENILPAW